VNCTSNGASPSGTPNKFLMADVCLNVNQKQIVVKWTVFNGLNFAVWEFQTGIDFLIYRYFFDNIPLCYPAANSLFGICKY
jgi:hypothetical protein